MTDKELLEFAAKAAEYDVGWVIGTHIVDQHDMNLGYFQWHRYGSKWNPLASDGDALRLAVKLNLDINTYPTSAEVGARLFINGGVTCQSIERTSPDKYAATRRAIVRAAAEIGRTL